MYYYVLGCAITCLILCGIGSMDTVDVKPAEIFCKTLLWPVTLLHALVRSGSTRRMHMAR